MWNGTTVVTHMYKQFDISIGIPWKATFPPGFVIRQFIAHSLNAGVVLNVTWKTKSEGSTSIGLCFDRLVPFDRPNIGVTSIAYLRWPQPFKWMIFWTRVHFHRKDSRETAHCRHIQTETNMKTHHINTHTHTHTHTNITCAFTQRLWFINERVYVY